MTAPKREMLHDIEPGPPARAWHAATPPVCPTCGCDHSYPVWADRDALRSLYAERDRALARIERLRNALDEALHILCDQGYAGELAPVYAQLQPGDLDAVSGEVQP